MRRYKRSRWSADHRRMLLWLRRYRVRVGVRESNLKVLPNSEKRTMIPTEPLPKRAYVALGSNIEPQKYLQQGLNLLAEQFSLLRMSRIYRTPPWGYLSQAPFWNAVLELETQITPPKLLAALLEVESRCDRQRSIPNGPRTLDLDLLLHGTAKIESEALVLPHPRLHERGFVLQPLCDLLPSAEHPRLGGTLVAWLEQADRSGIQPLSHEVLSNATPGSTTSRSEMSAHEATLNQTIARASFWNDLHQTAHRTASC